MDNISCIGTSGLCILVRPQIRGIFESKWSIILEQFLPFSLFLSIKAFKLVHQYLHVDVLSTGLIKAKTKLNHWLKKFLNNEDRVQCIATADYAHKKEKELISGYRLFYFVNEQFLCVKYKKQCIMCSQILFKEPSADFTK